MSNGGRIVTIGAERFAKLFEPSSPIYFNEFNFKRMPNKYPSFVDVSHHAGPSSFEIQKLYESLAHVPSAPTPQTAHCGGGAYHRRTHSFCETSTSVA